MKLAKKLIIIPIHSWVDCITNSSTELFVSSEGELSIIKSVLQEILDNYNNIEGTDYTYGECFEEPYRFNIDEYRAEKAEWKNKQIPKKTSKTGAFPLPHVETYFCSEKFPDVTSVWVDLKDEDTLKNLRGEYIQNGNQKSNYSHKSQSPFEEELDVIEQELKKQYHSSEKYDENYFKIKSEAIEYLYNELSSNKEITNQNWWINPNNYVNTFYSRNMEEIHNKIIISGKSDNSIPYDIFDTIDDALNAYHIHLG